MLSAAFGARSSALGGEDDYRDVQKCEQASSECLAREDSGAQQTRWGAGLWLARRAVWVQQPPPTPRGDHSTNRRRATDAKIPTPAPPQFWGEGIEAPKGYSLGAGSLGGRPSTGASLGAESAGVWARAPPSVGFRKSTVCMILSDRGTLPTPIWLNVARSTFSR